METEGRTTRAAAEWAERPVPAFAGRAWTFADGLAAADILPRRFWALDPAEARAGLFADLDPALADRLAVGDVLVAGHDLGAGEGSGPASRALAAAGMVAVVAASYARGFREALLAAGVPAFRVDAPAMFRTGDRLRFSVESGVVANQSSGDRQALRDLDETILERLRARFDR